jgi:hypothetical protein
MAHSSICADRAELLGVARDLCAVAAAAFLIGSTAICGRLVDQAAAVLELRRAVSGRGELDERGWPTRS